MGSGVRETRLTTDEFDIIGSISKRSKHKLLRQIEIMDRTKQNPHAQGASAPLQIEIHLLRSHKDAEIPKCKPRPNGTRMLKSWNSTVSRISKSKVTAGTKVEMKCPRCTCLISARWR